MTATQGTQSALPEALSLSRPSQKRPLSVLIAPARRRHPDSRPSTILFVSDPERAMGGRESILEGLYGLSRAEARLAAGLMQGKSLDETAGELGISIHTGRTHLKRVLSKTSTRRQGELIRLLLAGPATMRTIQPS